MRTKSPSNHGKQTATTSYNYHLRFSNLMSMTFLTYKNIIMLIYPSGSITLL